MDIKTLSERMGIPVRQIRYILDHELLPIRSWIAGEHAVGRARAFDSNTAVVVACAAYLLEAGYKRESVREMLESISKIMPSGRNQLALPIIAHEAMGKRPSRVQFGDGRYVRWITGRNLGTWIDPASPIDTFPNLTPKVIVELNFGEIRNQVMGENETT